jgi:hypothetical protein
MSNFLAQVEGELHQIVVPAAKLRDGYFAQGKNFDTAVAMMR